MPRIGLLVHGRHVETAGWESIVWGEAPNKLGALPMMILVLLNRGPENISQIVFGTGASKKDGLFESEYMKRFLLQNLSLDEFDLIRDHPNTQMAEQRYLLYQLVDDIVCETTSQNTVQEIAAAAKLFAEADVTEVIQITCASHAPRCIRDSAIAFEQGLIPAEQVWSVVRDMTTFTGTSASDVAIFEPPHRGDDPMLQADIKPHQVFPRLFKLPTLESKVSALKHFDQLITDTLTLPAVQAATRYFQPRRHRLRGCFLQLNVRRSKGSCRVLEDFLFPEAT